MLRAWSRWVIARHFSADDYAIIISALLIMISMGLELKSEHSPGSRYPTEYIANSIIVTAGGFGRHIWTVPLDNLAQILGIFYAVQVLYAMIQGFTKVSICLFYLRIFPQPWFQLATKCTIAFITASCTAFIFAIAFQCSPPSSFWDREKHSKCINQTILTYSGAGASILQHIIILLLPIPCISSLKIGRGKKFSLFVMFSLGTFALATSLVRVRFLSGFGSTKDITWDNSDVEIWSVIELVVAFVCACLPALRPLLVRYVPIMFSAGRSMYAAGSQPINGGRSKGSITVASAFSISHSRGGTGHVKLDESRTRTHVEVSRDDSDDIDMERGKNMMSSMEQHTNESSGRAWSVGSEETELVDMPRAARR
jgi:hypothetical protein